MQDPKSFIVGYARSTEDETARIIDLRSKISSFIGVPFCIVKEPIGHVFNRELCEIYIRKLDIQFSESDIDLCFYIMCLLIKKADTVEIYDSIEMNWYGMHKRNGFLAQCDKYSFGGKMGEIVILMNSRIINISYYYADKLHYTTLLELIKNRGDDLQMFFKYWRSVMDYETLFQILLKFGLPANIVDFIICMAAKKFKL